MNISEIIGRELPLFDTDVKANESYLREVIESSRILVIGGAGSIGKAVTKLYTGDVTVEAIQDFVAKEFGEVSSSTQPAAPVDMTQNVVEAQSRVETLNQIGVNAEPVDVQAEFAKFVRDSNAKPRDTINAKLRMLDTLKEDK